MLDTLVLMVNYPNYKIIDNGKFTPSTDNLFNKKGGFRKYTNNPTKEQKEKKYYPRLTIYKRGYGNMSYPLKIEFSVPKLLYENNLEEVSDNDFELVVKTLRGRLLEMGVNIDLKSLKESIVSTVHFSKNIELEEGYTANYAIQELQKVNVSKRKDVSVKEYRNGGEAIQIYTSSYAMVIYDKIADINKSPKRSIDSGSENRQMNLLKENRRNILRIEFRITNKRYIKKILSKLGYKKNPMFKDIFKKQISQHILREYWSDYYGDKSNFVFDWNEDPKLLFRNIQEHKNNITVYRTLKLIGLYWLTSKVGFRETRQLIEEYSGPNQWYGLKKDLGILNEISMKHNQFGVIKQIKNKLKWFLLN